MARPLLAVLGPTATGKRALALTLAERLSGEIVNCDSTAVFRGFDIGTDKVPLAEQRGIPHHLTDFVDPAADYTAADYARDAARVIGEAHPGRTIVQVPCRPLIWQNGSLHCVTMQLPQGVVA